MNEEEKKAIETMQHWIEYEKENKDEINKADELIEIQETVLNLLEKKDKIIDLMAEQLAGLAIFDIEKDEPLILGDKEEVKQYFKEKVEDRV